mmetsp:Transcript_24319/g.24235  ORF Transcript_24319/g.24235 Transcript_24319/m.24235 type:complete len:131 (-) Transcript_24319:53-445(-)
MSRNRAGRRSQEPQLAMRVMDLYTIRNKYGYKHDLSKKSDATKEILSGSKLPTKKHFGGNFKNFPTKNHIYAHSQKKTFTSSQVKSIPVSTTANFLGTSSCQDVDVLQGFHKKKVKYRPIQAKDATPCPV